MLLYMTSALQISPTSPSSILLSVHCDPTTLATYQFLIQTKCAPLSIYSGPSSVGLLCVDYNSINLLCLALLSVSLNAPPECKPYFVLFCLAFLLSVSLNAPPECKPQGGRGFVFLLYAQSFSLCLKHSNQYLNG